MALVGDRLRELEDLYYLGCVPSDLILHLDLYSDDRIIDFLVNAKAQIIRIFGLIPVVIEIELESFLDWHDVVNDWSGYNLELCVKMYLDYEIDIQVLMDKDHELFLWFVDKNNPGKELFGDIHFFTEWA
jgi:hypothetical protein